MAKKGTKPRFHLSVGAVFAAVVVHRLFFVLVEAVRPKHLQTGSAQCPCLDSAPTLRNRTVNELNPSATSMGHATGREDCLLARNISKLREPNQEYCYPTDYGINHCDSWDFLLPPECASFSSMAAEIPEKCRGGLGARNEISCQQYFVASGSALPWCKEPWCYVDANNCILPHTKSYYFEAQGLSYSYDTCGSTDYFNIWNAVQLEMCQLFAVVEKPYPIMWLSCWACAFLQQLIDATRYFEELQDRLSTGQRLYLLFQLFILITETTANIQRIPWRHYNFWSNYNLYVYVFINSSVFVRATMMSQVVWDWYDAGLLKYSILPWQIDAKGWTDEMRAFLLVMIFQFASSMGIFGVISVTHLIPALIVYHWIFMAVAAGLVKSRTWVAAIGLDPESRSGRALVMGTNSFLSCMGIQILVTSMVRVYAGEWNGGYFVPLKNDFLSRRLEVWYTCHLGKGISFDIFWDQDFVNLFIR